MVFGSIFECNSSFANCTTGKERNVFWVCSIEIVRIRTVIRDQSDHCASKEPVSLLRVDSLVPLVNSDPIDLGSLILLHTIPRECTKIIVNFIGCVTQKFFTTRNFETEGSS